MPTLPSTEAILLEIHQSLVCQGFQTNKRNKFITGQASLETYTAMGVEIVEAIFAALDMDPEARLDALDHFLEFANAYKTVELNTWTYEADERQVLWALAGHLYVPALARRVGFWNLVQSLDRGMPGGRFWYLPEIRDADGKASLYLPVSQVVDWLLDLLGMPLEEFADRRSNATDGYHDGLRRSLYNWRGETTISPEAIRKYFSDDSGLEFLGTFLTDHKRTPSEQFADALSFVKQKNLTADRLRWEIPMTTPGRLEAILDSRANAEEQALFVQLLAERFSTPSMRIIRQRLLLARAVQDGYIRLLKTLCPGVDRLCTNPMQNKILQLFGIYKLIYNLTIEAWRHCRHQGEAAENTWFERHLPEIDKHSLFLSILPSLRETANQELAHWLTRYFFGLQAGTELDDYFGIDEQTGLQIIQNKIKRVASFEDEIESERKMVVSMKNTSPWRALQREERYWVIAQVAQNPDIHSLGKQAAIQRLKEVAKTPGQTVQAILLELDGYLNGDRKNQSKDTKDKVHSLLEEAKAIPAGYELWKAPMLQYEAKHLLACNDFDGAIKLFRRALEMGLERSYGPLRGEAARDCLALMVANGKLIPNNHEKYYRETLAGGIVGASQNNLPPIEEVARAAFIYFWDTLYKPYPGFKAEKPRSLEAVKKIFESLIPLIHMGDQAGLHKWIKSNRPLLKSPIPDVEGNSIIMALIKLRTHPRQSFLLKQQLLPNRLQSEAPQYEAVLENWRQFLKLLVQESPGQLNIHDLKRQTPLMLMAEAGDTDMVELMLKAGADPDMQDWQGMTALHSACKSRVESCVDALLNHPCQLNKLTIDERSPLHTACWTGNSHAVMRLSQIAPQLVWQRDTGGRTPLELTEYFIDNPDALDVYTALCSKNGTRCASRKELELIMQLLEKVPPTTNAVE